VAEPSFVELLDSGLGIPAADRERVFRRFQRGGASATPGSGLGLAIAEEVVKQHSGRIKLGDGSGGSGLKVTVRLPVARASS
jgi:signal transduction histidine kinase